jgi:RimJ/RimL family protein N-acetyltransferase
MTRLNIGSQYFSRISPIKSARIILKMLQPLDFHFYLVNLDPSYSPPAEAEGVKFYGDALERLIQKRNSTYPTEFFRDKIAEARLCFLAEVNDEMASIVWVYDANNHRQLIDLRPTELELNASSTVPKFAGRGLYRDNMQFALHWLAQKGTQRVWASAASDNPIPMRQMPKIGFVKVATIHRCSLFGPKFRAREFIDSNPTAPD